MKRLLPLSRKGTTHDEPITNCDQFMAYWPVGSLIWAEAYGFAGLLRRIDKFMDSFKNALYMLVVGPNLTLQFGNLVGQVLVSQCPLAQAYEGLDDLDIDLNSALATKNAGKHAYAVFSERKRCDYGMLEGGEPITVCDEFLRFFFRQAEHETIREPFAIPLYRLIEGKSRHFVKRGKVPVNHDFMAAYYKNLPFDIVYWKQFAHRSYFTKNDRRLLWKF